jgi:hypothetical protein
MLSSIARYAIIVYAVFAALTQLGIAVQLTSNTFLILLGAVALAAALAFGIGGREVARDIIERAYERRQEVTDGSSSRQSSSTTAGGRQDESPEAHRLQRDV